MPHARIRLILVTGREMTGPQTRQPNLAREPSQIRQPREGMTEIQGCSGRNILLYKFRRPHYFVIKRVCCRICRRTALERFRKMHSNATKRATSTVVAEPLPLDLELNALKPWPASRRPHDYPLDRNFTIFPIPPNPSRCFHCFSLRTRPLLLARGSVPCNTKGPAHTQIQVPLLP